MGMVRRAVSRLDTECVCEEKGVGAGGGYSLCGGVRGGH